MERLRSSAPAVDTSSETDGSARSEPSLEQLVDAVRSPGVMRTDVDALLRGLARPPGADESPRARADFLLSLLDSRHLCSMKGSNGATVRDGAVKAMMDLGHPYALEIPPEALGRERPLRAASGPGRRSIPVLGILVALVGSSYALAVPPVSLLLAVPALTALLGGWLEKRLLQRVGLWMMGLVSLGWLGIAFWLIIDGASRSGGEYTGLEMLMGLLALIPSSLAGLGAFLLRHPAWRVEEKPSEDEETA